MHYSFSAHFRSTSVSLVGLQVWRGSLLLADYLLAHHSDLDIANARVIELAAGTGITSLVSAALGAKSVLCTGEEYDKLIKITLPIIFFLRCESRSNFRHHS